MKTIGLLGGMSWKSSIEYERILNEGARDALGGTASADLIIRSYNFAEIESLQAEADWDAAARILATDAQRLETAGAEMIVLCTNTMHVVAPAIEAAIDVPFLHIADTTAEAILRSDIQTVALLGTRYTMEQDFYRGRLERRGIEVLIPAEPDLTVVHNIIFDELVQGIVADESRAECLSLIERLIDRGVQGVIAGCTEIELLVHAEHLRVPYFPTARLHAEAAIRAALR